MAISAGPAFRFNEAISFLIECADQAEIDHLWTGLQAGGGREKACGWVEDAWGVSWQITPRRLMEMMKSPDRAASRRASEAMMTMIKLDIARDDAKPRWSGIRMAGQVQSLKEQLARL